MAATGAPVKGLTPVAGGGGIAKTGCPAPPACPGAGCVVTGALAPPPPRLTSSRSPSS